MKKKLDIAGSLREGFGITRGNVKAALAIMGLFGIVELVFGAFDLVVSSLGFNSAVTLIGLAVIARWLVLAWFKAGWVFVGMRSVRSGHLTIDGVLSGYRYVLPYFMTRLVLTGLFALIVVPAAASMATLYAWSGPSATELRELVGWDALLSFVARYGVFVSIEILILAFDLIPLVMVATYFGFALYILVDMEVGPVTAMRLSGRITRGAMPQLIAFAFVAALVNLAGLLCLIVGLLFTMPATSLAHLCIYRDLLRQTNLWEGEAELRRTEEQPVKPGRVT